MNERRTRSCSRACYVQTSPKNYFPIAKARMVRYRKNLWVLFGPLVNPR